MSGERPHLQSRAGRQRVLTHRLQHRRCRRSRASPSEAEAVLIEWLRQRVAGRRPNKQCLRDPPRALGPAGLTCRRAPTPGCQYLGRVRRGRSPAGYRRTHRVPMAELRTFIDLLREELGVPYPLAHKGPSSAKVGNSCSRPKMPPALKLTTAGCRRRDRGGGGAFDLASATFIGPSLTRTPCTPRREPATG
jgi:hypothetical protein